MIGDAQTAVWTFLCVLVPLLGIGRALQLCAASLVPVRLRETVVSNGPQIASTRTARP